MSWQVARFSLVTCGTMESKSALVAADNPPGREKLDAGTRSKKQITLLTAPWPYGSYGVEKICLLSVPYNCQLSLAGETLLRIYPNLLRICSFVPMKSRSVTSKTVRDVIRLRAWGVKAGGCTPWQNLGEPPPQGYPQDGWSNLHIQDCPLAPGRKIDVIFHTYHQPSRPCGDPCFLFGRSSQSEKAIEIFFIPAPPSFPAASLGRPSQALLDQTSTA